MSWLLPWFYIFFGFTVASGIFIAMSVVPLTVVTANRIYIWCR